MEFIRQNLIDIAVAVLFLCFAAGYGRRGLYRSLAGVVVTIAAVLGALLLTRLLAGMAADWLYPRVAERFAGRVDLGGVRAASTDGLTAQLEQILPAGFLNLVRKLGMQLDAFVSAAAGGSAVVADAQRAANDAVDALLYQATASVTRIVLFFLFLLVLRLLLSGVKGALGRVFRLPVLRPFDVLGGAVLGLVICAILVYIALWLCDLFRVEAVLSLAGRSRILTEFLNL